MALLACTDVSFAYDGHVAVSGLNFSVEEGDYLCVVGENGSGKSTLIKGLLRLIAPHTGKISAEIRLDETGYLPQQTAAQRDFPASAREVVLSGRLALRGIRPFYTRADREAAMENMKRLGIEDLAQACYRELSGGQQQRVLLARALCATRRLLLLDEPVSGLDPIVTQELYRLISWINRELGIAIIMVSHDIVSAVPQARHILHLGTRQLFYGAREEYEKSDIGRAYLEGVRHVGNA